MRKLTERQTKVFEFIRDHIENTGCPPTRAEIAKAMEYRSINAAEDHLRALARKGFIVLKKGISRGIFLPETGLPLISQVTPGQTLLAEDHIEDYLRMKGSFFAPEAQFFFRMNDEGMKDIGIFKNDILAVHQTNVLKNGQIVLVHLNDQVLVKRYSQEDKVITLTSENKLFSPIEIDANAPHFNIEGRITGLLRSKLIEE